MSEQEHSPEPRRRGINPATTIVGGALLIPLMALSAWGLVEEFDRPFAATMCFIQIAGLLLLWWLIGRERRWAIVLLYLTLAAAFYLLTIGICASGDYR